MCIRRNHCGFWVWILSQANVVWDEPLRDVAVNRGSQVASDDVSDLGGW